MYLTVKGITLYYEKHGNSKNTIVILPGWGNTRETFRYIIEYFKNQYSIYIVDYPGFGNSPIPTKTLTIYDYTELIMEFLKIKEIINPIIISHSFGGRITAVLSSNYNYQINKLILIDVAGIKPKKTIKKIIKQNLYKLKKRLIKLLAKQERCIYEQKLFQKYASPDYLSLPLSMQQTFKNIVNEDLKKHYKNINCETLILWGEKDEDTPLKDGIKINQLIKESALIKLPNTTHYSYLQHPTLVNQIIYAFIKKDQ